MKNSKYDTLAIIIVAIIIGILITGAILLCNSAAKNPDNQSLQQFGDKIISQISDSFKTDASDVSSDEDAPHITQTMDIGVQNKDLFINTYDYTGVYTVEIINIAKEKDKEAKYKVHCVSYNESFNEDFNLTMPESTFNEIIGEGTKTIAASFYVMEVRYEKDSFNFILKSSSGYESTFYRTSLKGEEPFTKENSEELLNEARESINYKFIYDEPVDYQMTDSVAASNVDWY